MSDINSKIHSRKLRYGSNQIRYAAVYIVLTFLVLVFLNYHLTLFLVHYLQREHFSGEYFSGDF